MNMRYWSLALVLVLLLTACGGSAETGGTLPQAELEPTPLPSPSLVRLPNTQPAIAGCELAGTLRLGAVESLTSPAAAYGLAIRDGIELAVEEVNAQKAISPNATLEVIFKDDEGDKDRAAAAFQEFIDEDEVLGLIGPTYSTSAFVADPLAQAASIPVMGTSNGADGITEIGSYVFRNSLPEAFQIPNTINAVREALGIKTAVILYGNDDRFTTSTYEVMQKAADEQGIEVLMVATFVKGDTDFTEALTQVKALQPDALFVGALVEEGAALVRQAREMGIDIPVIGGNGFNTPTLMEIAGPAADGVISGAAWFIDNDIPRSQLFVEAFRKKYNRDPDQFSAQSYTAVWLYAWAIRDACSTNRQAIRDALAATQLVETPLGLFSFLGSREPLHRPVILIVKDGEYTLFEHGN